MISLKKSLHKRVPSPQKDGEHGSKRVSVRDKLLIKEIQEMESNLPPTCQTNFPNPNRFDLFNLVISPDEGYWNGGCFLFQVNVPEDYNIVPPSVCCHTKIWHPNINEKGAVCLSLLRQNSLDSTGWAPTRQLKDVVWGLNSLFTDLLNFDDPLNVEAAEHYEQDKDSFRVKVRDYIQQYAKT